MIDPEVLALFSSQFGIVSTRQLLALSTSRRSLVRAQTRGTLMPVIRSVHRLAGTELTFEGRAVAALLHCGPAAFLDGYSAGAVHGLREMPRKRIVVTSTERIRAALPPWIRGSTTTWFDCEDIVELGPLRVAAPLRMMVRLAATSTTYRLERAAEDAWHRGLITPADIAAYLDAIRAPGREGVTKLDQWLRSVHGRQWASQSGLEMDALQAARLGGLPEPVRQYPLRLRSGEVGVDAPRPAHRRQADQGDL